MKDIQMRQRRRLSQVRIFAEEQLADNHTFDAVRARLDAAEARLQALVDEQTDARMQVPADAREIESLWRTLRERRMIPIGRAGKRLLAFAPGAERALTVPKKHARLEKLLAAAQRMASYVRRHARLFVDVGFPRDFLAQLRAATQAVRARVARTGSARRRYAKATAALARELAHVQRDIFILDALLANAPSDNPTLLANWRDARRTSKRMGRPRTQGRRKRAPGAQDPRGRSSD